MTYRSAIKKKKKGPLKKSALSLETEQMATWRAERTVCRKGELIFPGRSENAPAVFFLFWLISVSGICRETQRKQGKRVSSHDHLSLLFVSPSFPFPVLALGLGLSRVPLRFQSTAAQLRALCRPPQQPHASPTWWQAWRGG